MRNFKTGFTMIELIFVIVVLGILAAVAVPKFSATRVDAQIAKGKSDIASIRSALVTERQSRLIKGDSAWITKANLDSDGLFGGVLMYGITSADKDGGWTSSAAGTYVYKAGGKSTTFTYDNTKGTFTCTKDTGYCNELVN